jgi:hypothetical protein
VLTAVRAGYDRVLRWLEPQVAVRRIDCSGRTADEIATAVGDEFRRAAESYPA